jgi:hypothetical protein
MHLTRIFTRKRVAVVVATYLVLWALTASIGCRQARRFVLTRAELPGGIREMPHGSVYECCAPAYWFHARSYAPFFVTVSFDFAAGEFAYGYTSVILWFGVLGPGITTSSGIT